MTSPLILKRPLPHESTDGASHLTPVVKRPRILALNCGSPLMPGPSFVLDPATNKPRSTILYAVLDDSPPPTLPSYLDPQLSLGSAGGVDFPASTESIIFRPQQNTEDSVHSTTETKILDCYEILHEAPDDQQQRRSDASRKAFVVRQLPGTGEGSGKVGLCRRISYEKYCRYVELYRRFTGLPVTDDDERQLEVDYDEDAVFRRLWPDGCRLFTVGYLATKEPAAHFLFTPRHHGSLHVHVVDKKKLHISEALNFFRQIVETVAFCHARGVVLRDVKLRKFVFADPLRTNVRFCDLDEFFPLADPHDDSMRERNGCPAYVSPEIIDFRSLTYAGRPADVWGLGVLLYVMMVGRYPFYDTTPLGLFLKIRAAKLPLSERAAGAVPPVLRYALRCLLSKEAPRRPTAADILRMPWCCDNLHVCNENSSTTKDGAVVAVDILVADLLGNGAGGAQSIEMLGGSSTVGFREDGATSADQSANISNADVVSLTDISTENAF